MHSSPLKGVNLGGWLIAERWLTPSVFAGTDAIDEYSLSRTGKGRTAIETHRKSFIKESDFVWMHQNGINAVRLPVGYWMFHSDDSLLPHVSYVDWTMEMAKKYDLEVIIDFHGLKGSQNGRDHSGKVGRSEWFKHKAYRQESLRTLERIAKRYRDHPQFWGLQIINEPRVGLFHFKLRRYYHQAYHLLRGILKDHTFIIYSDGFTPRLLSGALSKASHKVMMDVHLYHPLKLWSSLASVNLYYKYLKFQKHFLQRLSKRQPIIIGEWSGVFRQPVFNSMPTSEHGELIKEHTKRQIESFEYTAGWFYWNYKAERPGVWDFRSQVEEGIIEM